MSVPNTIDIARVELLLGELRLPGVKLMWAKLAAQSDKEGWPAARFLAVLAELEVADRVRRRISASTPIVRMPGAALRIGTTSASQMAASGSNRRRARGAAFCDGSRGSASTRKPVARLMPALAAATVVSWVFRILMYSLIWWSVMWRPGKC